MESICLGTQPLATYIAISEENIHTDQFSGICLRFDNVWACTPKSFAEENSGKDNKEKERLIL